MPILHSWEGRRRTRPPRPNSSVSPTRIATTRSTSSGMSSSRAVSRTRRLCTVCRPLWPRGTAASWRSCSPTCRPGGPAPQSCSPGSRPPFGATAAARLTRRPTGISPGPRPRGPRPRGGPETQRPQTQRPQTQRPETHRPERVPEPGWHGPGVSPTPLSFPPGRGGRFTIGRTRDCDLCLSDLSVSRLHAELVRNGDGWLLSDLGSHNGTRLNGWLVRETVPVRGGDRVEFGSVTFILRDDPQAPAASG